MTKMHWDRVRFEDLIARQGSEWVQEEFYHHAYFEPGVASSPKVFCKYCKERFTLKTLEKHVHATHQFIVIKRAVGDKGTKIIRRPLKKQLKETRVGRELIAMLKSPIPKKLRRKKAVFLKSTSQKSHSKPPKPTTSSTLLDPKRLMLTIRKLVPKKKD